MGWYPFESYREQYVKWGDAEYNNADTAESLKQLAIEEAEKDVETYINKPMWFIIGCIFPGVGLLAPYMYKPPVPAGELGWKIPGVRRLLHRCL